MLRRNLLLLAMLSCVIAPAASAEPTADASGVPARNTLVASINQALLTADLDALAAEYRAPDAVAHALAAMAIERVHGNFEQSSNIAKTCESSLKATEPFVAHYCARFAAANTRLLGDSQSAAKEEERISERYKAVLPPDQITNPDLIQAPVYESFSSIKAAIPDGISNIPIRKSGKSSSNIDAFINGHPQQLTMDTGASTMLGEETAKRLGVKILLENDGTIHGVLGGSTKKQLGLIEKLTFGNVEVDNVPVSIIPEERDILGIDVLQRLGTFEVQKDALRVFGVGASTPSCDAPLLLGTTYWGAPPRVLQQVQIDGAPQNVLFDTGSEFYLTANQPSTKGPLERGGQFRIRDANHGSQPVRFSRLTSDVEMAGKRYQLTYAAIEDVSLPFKFILGSGSLQDVTLFVDFKRRVSCLLPKFR